MTCHDDFDVNPLYAATHLPGERVRAPRKDIDVVIACVAGEDHNKARELHNSLKAGPNGSRPTVDKDALSALMILHSRHHRSLMEPQRRVIRADPPSTLEGMIVGVDKGGKDKTVYAAVKGDKILAVGPDELAVAFKAYLSEDPEARFKLVCKANGIDPTKYAGRNFGLQRMALGNELRNRVKKGTAVTVGGQVIK